MHLADVWAQLFNFEGYGELLALVRNSVVAGAVLGLTGGLVGVFVMARDLAFAVHAISELSFSARSIFKSTWISNGACLSNGACVRGSAWL